ncbi:MAG: YihY/virulence factor BrkB family protein [Thermoanaerobaculia bacterium]
MSRDRRSAAAGKDVSSAAPTAGPVAELLSVLIETGREWERDKVPRLAAALAYYALFSLAPLLVVAIGVAGFFFGHEAARGEVVAQFSALIGRPGARAVEELLAANGSRGKGLAAAVLGLATLLLGASGVFGELQDALNSIWNVEPRPNASWKIFLRRRFFSFAMVLGSGFLLLVSLVLSAGLDAASRLFTFHSTVAEFSWNTTNSILGLLLPCVLFALIFKLVPDAKIAWRDVWVGAVLTAALFALGRSAIGIYLGRSALDSTCGAAASLVAVVFWVYYSAQILFLGAELTQVISSRRRGPESIPKPGAKSATDRAADR